VVLNGNVTLQSKNGSGNITLGSTLDGAYNLAANTAGRRPWRVVGGTAALTSLTTDAGGTASLIGATTTGAQNYQDGNCDAGRHLFGLDLQRGQRGGC